jgi:sarcosine oxidase
MHTDHISRRILGFCVAPELSASCLCTCLTDVGFVIGPLDRAEPNTVVSVFSGHGSKHSAAVGDHAVRLITEGFAPAILAFDPRRLARGTSA